MQQVEKKIKAVVLLSGGLDSAVAALVAREEYRDVIALFINYGQVFVRTERTKVELFTQHFHIPLRSVLTHGLFNNRTGLTSPLTKAPPDPVAAETQKMTVVPNRNGLFLMMGIAEAILSGATEVWTGIHMGGRSLYPDNREGYLSAVQKIADVADDEKPILVRHPFSLMSKRNIVEIGHFRYGLSFHKYTWSCYRLGPYHCGECKACQTRREAFTQAGVPDLTVYSAP